MMAMTTSMMMVNGGNGDGYDDDPGDGEGEPPWLPPRLDDGDDNIDEDGGGW